MSFPARSFAMHFAVLKTSEVVFESTQQPDGPEKTPVSAESEAITSLHTPSFYLFHLVFSTNPLLQTRCVLATAEAWSLQQHVTQTTPFRREKSSIAAAVGSKLR